MIDAYVTKGTRVRASWLEAKLVSLAGMQPKTGASQISVTGVVRHIRSDHPTMPVNVTFFLDVEEGAGHEDHVTHCQKCDREHVEVKAKHVVEVLGSVSPPAPSVPDGGGDGGNGV